jgi:hypothetical protein
MFHVKRSEGKPYSARKRQLDAKTNQKQASQFLEHPRHHWIRPKTLRKVVRQQNNG